MALLPEHILTRYEIKLARAIGRGRGIIKLLRELESEVIITHLSHEAFRLEKMANDERRKTNESRQSASEHSPIN